MKKVLTVLLAIAVMFTFSFGSAFAATITPGEYNADASKGFFNDGWADLVKTTTVDTIALDDGANGTYDIDKTVLGTAALKEKAEIVYNYYMDNDSNVNGYLDSSAKLQALLLGTGTETVNVTEAQAKVDEFRLAVAAAQFAADKSEAKLDLASVITTKYSKEVMSDAHAQAAQDATNADITFVGKDYTYAQAAEMLVEYFDGEVDDIDDFDADVTIVNYKTASAELAVLLYDGDATATPVVKPALYPFGNLANNMVKLTGSYDLAVAYNYKSVKGTDENSAEVYYVNAKNTTNKWYSDAIAASDKSEAANIAAAKAQNAAAYAEYIVGKDSEQVKEADKWLKVADIVAEEIVKGNTAVTLGDIETAADRALYAKLAGQIEDLEDAAAKYAAEKNADGDLVRDAKDVQDLLEDGIAAIATAADEAAGEAARKSYDDQIKAAISATTAEKLQFLKDSVKKAAELAIAEAEEKEYYYKAELDEAKAIIDKYLPKIEAAEKDTDVQKLYREACKKIGKVELAAKLEADWLTAMTGTNNTGAGKLYNHAKDYVGYYNSTVEGDEQLDDTVLKAKVVDLIAESGVRTNKEIEKLDATAAAKALATKADVKAAKKAAKTAIDALPAKVKVADLALVQAAYDAIDAYGDVTESPLYTVNDLSAALANLVKDYNAEYAQKYTAVSTTDEAALLALVDEIEAVIDTLEDLEVPANSLGYLDDLKDSLNDYLYGTDNNSIQAKALDAVKAAIKAIPINVTEADKATVVKARELYDAYVAKYTDYEALKDNTTLKFESDGTFTYKEPTDWYAGYINIDIDDLTEAETILGLNADPEWAAVEALKIKAKSTAKKGSITVKWTVKGDATGIDGYEIWKSTKQSKGYKKAWTTTKQTYKNSKGLKKGTRYYYKVRAYKMIDGVKYTSDWSNKAYRKAK